MSISPKIPINIDSSYRSPQFNRIQKLRFHPHDIVHKLYEITLSAIVERWLPLCNRWNKKITTPTVPVGGALATEQTTSPVVGKVPSAGSLCRFFSLRLLSASARSGWPIMSVTMEDRTTSNGSGCSLHFHSAPYPLQCWLLPAVITFLNAGTMLWHSAGMSKYAAVMAKTPDQRHWSFQAMRWKVVSTWAQKKALQHRRSVSQKIMKSEVMVIQCSQSLVHVLHLHRYPTAACSSSWTSYQK